MESKIFKNKFSSIKAEVIDNGWVTIYDSEGQGISLGCYPNARFDIIEKAIKESRKIKRSKE